MLLRFAGRNTKHFSERLTERAARLKPAIELDIDETAPVSDIMQRKAHSTSTMIGMKRHADVPLELPTGSRGLDIHARQVLIGQAPGRIALNGFAQAFDQFRRASHNVHGTASLAWSVATMNRVARCGEERDIVRTRFSRGAGGATEHPGGLHCHVEYAFGTGITGKEGAEHLPVGWKSGQAKRLKRFDV